MIFFNQRRKQEFKPKGFPSGAMRHTQHAIERRQKLSVEERAQTSIDFIERVEWPQMVLDGLLEANHGRCAFCEATKPNMSVYRFRPYAHAHPVKSETDFECYEWLSFDWLNLHPICPDCLPEDPSFFPVNGNRAPYGSKLKTGSKKLHFVDREERDEMEPGPDVEAAKLLTPGQLVINSHKELRVDFDGKLSAFAPTGRAAKTITHFNLNCENTVRPRESVVDRLAADLTYSNDSTLRRISFDRDEFGGCKYLFLRKVAVRLREEFPDLRGISTTKARLVDGLLKCMGHPDYEKRIGKLLVDMEQDEGQQFRPSRERLDNSRDPARKKSQRGKPLLLSSVEIENFRSLESIKLKLATELSTPALERLTMDYDAQALLKTKAETLTEQTDPQSGEHDEMALRHYVPSMLILGENAAGKSTLLEAIAIATMDEEVRNELGLDASSYILDPTFLGARPISNPGKAKQPANVQLQFSPATSSEEGSESSSQTKAFTVQLKLSEKGASVSSNIPGEFQIPPVFAYGAQRLNGAQPRSDLTQHVDTLFRNDRQLSNPEKWLAGLDTETRNGVVQALRGLIQVDGRFESISPIEAGARKKPDRCTISLKKVRPAPPSGEVEAANHYTITQRMDAVSSGYRAIIAMVCDILDGLMKITGKAAHEVRQEHAIVLIDEIEAHLHPRWKINLTRGLRHALPNVTFVMTSHDPLCVRGMCNNEVVVMERVLRDAEVDEIQEKVQVLDQFPNPETLTIEQLLITDFFQLKTTDDTVATEQIISYWELLDREQAGSDLGTKQKKRLEEFKSKIDLELPYGRDPVRYQVYKAVAECMRERRFKGNAKLKKADPKVKAAVAEFLFGRPPDDQS